MLFFCLLFIYIAVFLAVMSFVPLKFAEERPTLEAMGFGTAPEKKKETLLKQLALVNRPLAIGTTGQRLAKDLSISYTKMSVEEFFLLKEIMIVLFVLWAFFLVPRHLFLPGILAAAGAGYYAPNLWLQQKIRKVKATIVRELPDMVDLLALCVNAGLDFMLSLKWVVERSPASVMVDQLNTVLQEINVGKPRRDALRDLAQRFNLSDLSTFSRTLIMADKMGTSMTDALNSLSIDMRYARFRRGEAAAMKAPLKLLVPLIFCIFPVVGILVMGPILLNFIKLDPFTPMSKLEAKNPQDAAKRAATPVKK